MRCRCPLKMVAGYLEDCEEEKCPFWYKEYKECKLSLMLDSFLTKQNIQNKINSIDEFAKILKGM